MTETQGPAACRSRREASTMETPEDVTTMLELHARGWGTKAIARELGCARNTVKRYLALGGWQAYAGGNRGRALDGEEAWLRESLVQHRGNAEVVRQELVREKGKEVSLRTVQRAVAEERRGLRAAARATVRYETPPGKQLQADFGQISVSIAGEMVKAHLCVLTLAWSRRIVVRAFRDERQPNWFSTMEAAFRLFGGVPEQVLVDNARALVSKHNPVTREVVFHERFLEFSRYWGFSPRACAPYRPQTKGKAERNIAFVKRNAIAGRTFESWAAFEAWLEQWSRENADQRVHGTTGERPADRFSRGEAGALRPLPDKPPFQVERELRRVVHNDACVEVDGNWYSVPWQLAKASVTVRVRDGVVTVRHGEEVVARHERLVGRRQRTVNPEHWAGLSRRTRAATEEGSAPGEGPEATVKVTPPPEFLRSLDLYAAAADGEAA